MEINSYAKINLGLHILNKRQDSLHNIITVFQEIDFYDQISIEKSDDFIFETNVDWLDKKNNTCIQAFETTKEKFPNISNIKINLVKNIPTSAGLGGGSSNGTAVLKGMNELFALKMSQDKLISQTTYLEPDLAAVLKMIQLPTDSISRTLRRLIIKGLIVEGARKAHADTQALKTDSESMDGFTDLMCLIKDRSTLRTVAQSFLREL